jgi:hypothetical protein
MPEQEYASTVMLLAMIAGWHLCLDGLAARLHDAPAPAAERWGEHHERYARSFAT